MQLYKRFRNLNDFAICVTELLLLFKRVKTLNVSQNI